MPLPFPDITWLVAEEKLAGIDVISRKLEQGPPVQAPVEIRLFGDRFDKLHKAAVAIAGELETIAGTRDVRQRLAVSIRRRVVAARSRCCGQTANGSSRAECGG